MLKNLLIILFSIITGFILALTGKQSWINTDWQNYNIDFTFWWSIVSTIAGILLAFFGLWQYLQVESQKNRTKAQVKIWMECVDGVVKALDKVQQANHSTLKDALNNVLIIETVVRSLFSTFYQERVIKEEDYQENERKVASILSEKKVAELKSAASDVPPNKLSPLSSQKLSSLKQKNTPNPVRKQMK